MGSRDNDVFNSGFALIFSGEVGLGPGGIRIIRFFSGSLVRMLCVFVVVPILKVLSTGSV